MSDAEYQEHIFSSLPLEQLFSSRETVDKLFLKKYRLERPAILSDFFKRIGDDPQEHLALLKDLFALISYEGADSVSDNADAAMEILSSSEMRPIVRQLAPEAVDLYIKAVQGQTAKNDVEGGSIARLLKIGERIAPFLKRSERHSAIPREWDNVANLFDDPSKRHLIQLNTDAIERAFKRRLPPSRSLSKKRREQVSNEEKYDFPASVTPERREYFFKIRKALIEHPEMRDWEIEDLLEIGRGTLKNAITMLHRYNLLAGVPRRKTGRRSKK